MRKKEQRLWDTMKAHKPKDVILRRVENLVEAGMPDVLALKSCGKSAWIELKQVDLPVRATSKMMTSSPVNVDQINWHKQTSSIGIHTWVLVRDDKLNLYLFHGRLAEVLNGWSVEQCLPYQLALGWTELFGRIWK